VPYKREKGCFWGCFGGVFRVFLGCFGEGVKKGVFPGIYTYLTQILVCLKKQAKNVTNLEKKYFFNVLKNLCKNSAKYRKKCIKKQVKKVQKSDFWKPPFLRGGETHNLTPKNGLKNIKKTHKFLEIFLQIFSDFFKIKSKISVYYTAPFYNLNKVPN
jgi:hypothetical protein